MLKQLALAGGLLLSLGASDKCAGPPPTGPIPLNDLGTGTYEGEEGGLYPGGSNLRPAAHEAAGLAQAAQVVPRGTDGKPDPDGKIAVISVGMSNTAQSWKTFLKISDRDPDRNPAVVALNGAHAGVVATDMADRRHWYWDVVKDRLADEGLTRKQVQVAWLLQAVRQPDDPFPVEELVLYDALREIVTIARDKFPNLALLYLSSRIYAGYAVIALNPEPWAYGSAFSVKWLIEDQIDGDRGLNFDPEEGTVEAPWLAWGPYLWADGRRPRSDGLRWLPEDLAIDGTHPSELGQAKVALMLNDHFRTDTTTRSWYLASP